MHKRCKKKKRSIDCSKMEMPRARRKTPLKKAPSRLARCQPNDSSFGESLRSEIWFPESEDMTYRYV